MGTEILCINRQRFVVVVGKQKIKKIFVDETLLKINGQDYWLWLAYDEPNLHVCVFLLFHISRERTIFVCYQFFRQR
jgi:transposase-like protein